MIITITSIVTNKTIVQLTAHPPNCKNGINKQCNKYIPNEIFPTNIILAHKNPLTSPKKTSAFLEKRIKIKIFKYMTKI